MQFLRSLLLGASLTLILAGPASADSFPDKSKPIRLVIAQGPGSGADSLARALAKAMTDSSGATVVIDHKPGAETVVAVQSVLTSPADGYRFLLLSSSGTVLAPVMNPNLPYDMFRDLVPLAGVSNLPFAMNLGVSTQFKTAPEFIAAAKANPGKYTFASSSPSTRLAGELLQSSAGIKLLNVQYKTTAAASTALAGGEVDLMIVDPVSMTPLWQSGRARAVAVTTSKRVKLLPNLPTLKEEGLPNYEIGAWYSTYVAKGTPAPLVNAMRDLLRKAMQQPEMQAALAKAGMEPLELFGEEVTVHARKEMELWTKVVNAAGIKQ